MASTAQFLRDQIKEETWKTDHERAMACADLEQTIQKGLEFFNLFHSIDGMWSRRVQCGQEQFDEEVVELLIKAYKWWLQPCDEVVATIDQFEKDGFKVTGAPELREARTTVRTILKTDTAELISKLKRLRGAA